MNGQRATGAGERNGNVGGEDEVGRRFVSLRKRFGLVIFMFEFECAVFLVVVVIVCVYFNVPLFSTMSD